MGMSTQETYGIKSMSLIGNQAQFSSLLFCRHHHRRQSKLFFAFVKKRYFKVSQSTFFNFRSSVISITNSWIKILVKMIMITFQGLGQFRDYNNAIYEISNIFERNFN